MPEDNDPESTSFVIRLPSGIGGVLVFLLALIGSLGTAIAAPLGMLVVRRWTARHNRRRSVLASIVGAMLATSLAAAALFLVLFAVMPSPTQQDIQKAAREAQSKPVQLPDWYTKTFPQSARESARADSATQQLMRNPQFMTIAMVLAGGFAALMLGALGGGLGWCGSTLLGIAFFGRRATPPLQ